MRKFYSKTVNHQKLIVICFLVVTAICCVLQNFVSVDYDMKDYLPKDSASTVALDVMNSEYDGGIPNARVMINDVGIADALKYKDEISKIDGVTDVTWLDDGVDMTVPLETQDKDTVETYYKDNKALFTVTIDENKRVEAVNALRDLIGDENSMTGDAVSTATATQSTVSEIRMISVFAVLCVVIVLIITTTSWFEPFIVLAGLGVAIMINKGTNLIFGEISFVTNAAGPILQLAVSLDYSVFLLHRFEECLKQNANKKDAMVDALCKSTSSILSSGLTTVIGFLALLFMRFGIGPDLGLALAKGIAISLITVFVFMPQLILMTYKFIEKTKHKSFMPNFTGFGKFITKVMLPLVVVFAVVIAPSFLASNHNSYYYGSAHIFDNQTQTGQDREKIESTFGKNETFVILVPKDDLQKQKKLSNDLKNIDEVTSVISYVDTVGSEIPQEYLDSSILSKLVSKNYSRFVLNLKTDAEGEDTFDLVEEIRDTAQKHFPNEYYLAGEAVSTYDLMDTITTDTLKVNLIAIAAVFVVLLLSEKSIVLPIILVLAIETAIWINLSIPYFTSSYVFYIAYLIISSIQLGATVDYAILFSDRYREMRQLYDKKASIINTVSSTTKSLLTSGTVMTVVGFLLGGISTHGVLSQLGTFLGRGSLLSLFIVLFVLPGLIYIFDFLFTKKEYRLKDKKGKVQKNEK